MSTYWNTYTQTTLASYPTGPKFCQRTAPTWDGDTTPGGENSGKNCGPTCLVAEVYHTTGVYLPPDAIKGEILDPSGATDATITGTTTIDQLRAAVTAIAQIPTSVLVPTTTDGTGAGSLLNLVWAQTKNGDAVTQLRWWDHPQSGFYHWATAVGLDPTYVYVFDPWTGTVIAETYDQHRALFVGNAIPGGGMFAYQRPRDPWLS